MSIRKPGRSCTTRQIADLGDLANSRLLTIGPAQMSFSMVGGTSARPPHHPSLSADSPVSLTARAARGGAHEPPSIGGVPVRIRRGLDDALTPAAR
jgi:hypothetical protein